VFRKTRLLLLNLSVASRAGTTWHWEAALISSSRIFIILLIGEVGFLYLLRWPLLYNFNNFAFWDSGAYLVTHYLLQQGHRPFIYFGWQYGLLPLLIQELGFRLLGASPVSFLCLSVPCFVIVAVVVGRVTLLGERLLARVFVLLSLPLILTFEPDLPHSLEAALLSLGLMSQATDKYGRALAFAGAACFSKPSMGYLYGLVLLISVCFHPKLSPRRLYASGIREAAFSAMAASIRFFMPAVVTVLGLTLALSAVFGWNAVLHSLIPLGAKHAYQALHYGWQRIIGGFFYFPGARAGYYIGTPVSFWALGTVYLVVVAFLTVRIANRRQILYRANRQLVLSCVALHIGFIVLLYGSPASWTYYAYILVIGIVATQTWPHARAAIGALAVLAACANYSGIRSAVAAWERMQPDKATAGLFADSSERAEWDRVVVLARGVKPVIVTNFGAAPLLFDWLTRPAGAFLVAGIATDDEIVREDREIEAAGAVIIPTIPGLGDAIKDWPGTELRHAVSMNLIFKGTYFELYKKCPAIAVGAQFKVTGRDATAARS
jgi:hypothetical protein